MQGSGGKAEPEMNPVTLNGPAAVCGPAVSRGNLGNAKSLAFVKIM
jgi:hypothetical protein